MKLLVAGYSQDETHRVSAELRTAGHQVLGALGRSGARTFVKVVTPDLVVVPSGEMDTVRSWIADLPVDELRWVCLDPGEDAVTAVAGASAGASPSSAPPTAYADVTVAEAGEPSSALGADTDISFEPPDTGRGGTVILGRPLTQPRDRRTPGFGNFDHRAPERPEGELDANLTEVSDEPPPLPGERGPRRSEMSAPLAGEPAASEAASPPSDLVSKLAQTRFGDYHSILEVEPGASPYAVREQFTRLSRLYSPRGWPRRLGPDELEILQEVASGIRDAFLILGDPELRARYERALLGGGGSSTTRR